MGYLMDNVKTPSTWELREAEAHLMIARYLMSKADERNTTHGEKHLRIMVALMEVDSAIFLLTGKAGRQIQRWQSTDPSDVDIPY
jgi:hypothetical protein